MLSDKEKIVVLEEDRPDDDDDEEWMTIDHALRAVPIPAPAPAPKARKTAHTPTQQTKSYVTEVPTKEYPAAPRKRLVETKVPPSPKTPGLVTEAYCTKREAIMMAKAKAKALMGYPRGRGKDAGAGENKSQGNERASIKSAGFHTERVRGRPCSPSP
ncbi:hypothetical protein M426DRAFT_156813 [Hypoxylon sp. CI-4A]|nr:hypothetical protein M426DRAFT_156813 [Hypoxylon sp. CI-4A]